MKAQRVINAIIVLLLILLMFLLVGDASAADCGKCLTVRIAQAEKALNVRPPGGYVPHEFACGDGLVCETRGGR